MNKNSVRGSIQHSVIFSRITSDVFRFDRRSCSTSFFFFFKPTAPRRKRTIKEKKKSRGTHSELKLLCRDFRMQLNIASKKIVKKMYIRVDQLGSSALFHGFQNTL